MSIGTSWADGTWVDGSWVDGSWGGEGITGTIAVTAFAAQCALFGQVGTVDTLSRMRRLTSTREDIPIPAGQPHEVRASVRASQYRLDHPGTKARIPLPARAEPTVQQSLRAIRKRLERLS